MFLGTKQPLQFLFPSVRYAIEWGKSFVSVRLHKSRWNANGLVWFKSTPLSNNLTWTIWCRWVVDFVCDQTSENSKQNPYSVLWISTCDQADRGDGFTARHFLRQFQNQLLTHSFFISWWRVRVRLQQDVQDPGVNAVGPLPGKKLKIVAP